LIDVLEPPISGLCCTAAKTDRYISRTGWDPSTGTVPLRRSDR
jgi:hypothetical protein